MNTYTSYTISTAFSAFWNRYVDFSGRSTRSAYWWTQLVLFLIGMITGVIDTIIGLDLISTVWSLVIFLPSWALMFRRFHDVGKSAWLILPISLLGIAGAIMIIVGIAFAEMVMALLLGMLFVLFSVIWGLVITCKDSQVGPNKWGASEKYPEA